MQVVSHKYWMRKGGKGHPEHVRGKVKDNDGEGEAEQTIEHAWRLAYFLRVKRKLAVKVAIRERKFVVVPARCFSAYTCYTMSRTKTNRPLHEEEAKASFSMLSKRVSAFLNIISSKIIIPVDTYSVDDEGTMHRESCSQYIRILILGI